MPLRRRTSPAVRRIGFRELREAFERISAIHVRSDIQRVFSEGDEVCVIYDFVTDTVGTLPTIEWIKLDRGRLASIRLYNDQLLWQNMRDELMRRAKA